MFNNLTFGCVEIPVRVNGLGFVIHTGGLTEKELDKEVIREALTSLPQEILTDLWEFNQSYPVVIQQGNLNQAAEAAFYPFTETMCGILLTVSVFRKRLNPSAVYHELVHYHQWKRGDLQATGEMGSIGWKGEVIPLDLDFGLAYLRTPWEQEAYRKQFEWDFRNGRTRLSPDINMRLMGIRLLTHKFFRGIGGHILFGVVFMALTLVVPSDGWWWVLKGFLGFNVLNQVAAIALKLREKMKKREEEQGKIVSTPSPELD